MKPIEFFLAEVHPEVMQKGTVLLNGEAVEFGEPNRPMLRRLVKEHYAAGQEALSDFNKWLVRSEGMRPATADAITAVTWNVLCMTYDINAGASNPAALLDPSNPTYSYGMKIRISFALRLWARYKDNSALYEQVLLWLKRKPNTTPQYVLDTLETSPPYTREEFRRLLKALEEFKGAPRYPWGWPCLRLTFVCGIPFSDIVQLERVKIQKALEEREILLAVGCARGRRSVQTEIIEEELRYLLAFPYTWGVVGDLVDPGKTMRGHGVYSTHPLAKFTQLVFARAGLPRPGKNWNARVRWSAGWQYYQQTGNLVGTSQILGIRNLKRVSAFLEELKKRAEAAQKEKEENEAVDVEATGK